MKQTTTALIAAAVLVLFSTGELSAQGVAVANDGPSTYGGAPNVPHIFMFESLEADTLFWGSYGFQLDEEADPTRDYAFWDNWAGVPQEGEGSLILDWGLHSDQDWGGSNALQHFLPDSVDGEPRTEFYDFSDFTHINIWYNVLVPADPAATWRLKLHDASEGLGTAPTDETEDWYAESGSLYQDSEPPGWKMMSIPLESLGNVSPGSGGFSRPGCPASCWSGLYGNGELDLDKIAGFQLEFTGPQFGPTADSATAGTIVYDNFHVSGIRYNLLHAFDELDENLAHWKNSDAGDYTLTVVDDTTQGTGAAELAYNLVADQSWGGSVDIHYELEDGSFLEDMTQRTHLSLFYKVTEPASLAGQISLTVKLFDSSSGAKEEWHYDAGPIYEDTSGKWQRLLIPLKEGDGSSGFQIPSFIGEKGDNTLNADKLVGWELQLFGQAGTTTTGTILFDRFTGYGMQVTDFEAPAAVEGLDAVADEYKNIVSWEDVPDESGETYTIYASMSPIDDVNAEGVMVLERDIAEGTQLYNHQIYSPKVDQELSYYYAITAADAAGNVSEVASTSAALTNTAKGIATISLSVPAFSADGDLGEWAGIEPIHIAPGGDIGNIPDNFAITDAADLSADVYIAIDDEAIYFAADVTDDSFNPIPAGHLTNRWTFDAIEFYFGFYDGRRERHENYGADEGEVDLQINLYGENVLATGVDGNVLVAGEGDYLVTETETGYNVEVRLPFDLLGITGFQPLNGTRVPIDIVIMDNDLGGQDNREGILTYSPWNNDNSWQSPLNWFYTWIGDRIAVGVERLDLDVPQRFVLEQNYPNPFNPSTVIRYHVPQPETITLRVFNTLGQQVMTLVDADQAAGVYEVRFDASGLASGLYLYQLQAGDKVMSKSMLLAR
ncbi:MAG TPA: sugar-binding protein [Rhodothermales bacterium]|nr:sugar-binding protein [Rhodothermales bacterium]